VCTLYILGLGVRAVLLTTNGHVLETLTAETLSLETERLANWPETRPRGDVDRS